MTLTDSKIGVKMTDEQLYLSYVNDFITVAAFAEYYGMTEEDAHALIERERKRNKIGYFFIGTVRKL